MLVHLWQHIGLAGTALALALLGGVSFGVAAASIQPLRSGILALASVGRTIPSLAVLTLLLPWLGVGFKPAILALAILALPPILINVDLGIRSVALPLVDAATGLGMSAPQRFFRVIVPTAFPIAFAGVRTAATEVIASATLATLSGAAAWATISSAASKPTTRGFCWLQPSRLQRWP